MVHQASIAWTDAQNLRIELLLASGNFSINTLVEEMQLVDLEKSRCDVYGKKSKPCTFSVFFRSMKLLMLEPQSKTLFMNNRLQVENCQLRY